MRLQNLAQRLGVLVQGDDRDVAISSVHNDSRLVEPGSLFVCVPGFRVDGHEFARDAVDRGALVVVATRPLPGVAGDVPVLVVEDARLALARASALLYGEPTNRFQLAAVTGTNGKSTVSSMIYDTLSARERTAGLISTISCELAGEPLAIRRTSPTTPEAPELQRIFRTMADGGAEAVVMEASSMALETKRVDASRIALGVFMNLYPEHIRDHGSLERYQEAKLRLFDFAEVGLVNGDDPFAPKVLERASTALTFGLDAPTDIRAESVDIDSDGNTFVVRFDGRRWPVRTPIPGRYSVYNALACFGACVGLGLSPDEAAAGLQHVRTPEGRWEVIDVPREVRVIVDYAHTPDALQHVLSTLAELAARRVVVVFGCGGDRDHGKRPVMGELAGRFADVCFVTSDNPRSEDPQSIVDQILEGMRTTRAEIHVELDRRRAIRAALEHAEPGDTVLIAGKGHEGTQVIGDRVVDLKDSDIVREIGAEWRRDG